MLVSCREVLGFLAQPPTSSEEHCDPTLSFAFVIIITASRGAEQKYSTVGRDNLLAQMMCI